MRAVAPGVAGEMSLGLSRCGTLIREFMLCHWEWGGAVLYR